MMENWQGLRCINICSNLWLILWLIQDNELRSPRTFIIHSYLSIIYSRWVLLTIELILLDKRSIIQLNPCDQVNNVLGRSNLIWTRHDHAFSLGEPIFHFIFMTEPTFIYVTVKDQRIRFKFSNSCVTLYWKIFHKSCWTLSEVNSTKPSKLKTFSRLFRYCGPAECNQFHYKSNHNLYEQIVSSNIVGIKVVLKCVQPSVRSQWIKLILGGHSDRIRLTVVHKIVSNWLTQDVFPEGYRGCE